MSSILSLTYCSVFLLHLYYPPCPSPVQISPFFPFPLPLHPCHTILISRNTSMACFLLTCMKPTSIPWHLSTFLSSTVVSIICLNIKIQGWDTQIKKNTQNLPFWDRVTSLWIVFSHSSHLRAKFMISFFFTGE